MNNEIVDLTVSDDEDPGLHTNESLRRRFSTLSLQSDSPPKKLKREDVDVEDTNSTHHAVMIDYHDVEEGYIEITATREPPSSPPDVDRQIVYISDDEAETETDDILDVADSEMSEGFEEIAIINLLKEDDEPVQDIEILRTNSTSARRTFSCAPGKVVEFSNGSFMRIKSVEENQQKQTILVGQHFVRQNSFKAQVAKRTNEVVWILDHLPVPGQSTLTRHVLREGEIVQHRNLIMTNYTYPERTDHEHHPRNHPGSWPDLSQDLQLGVLFCRMKRCCVIKKGKIVEEMWTVLSEQEADPGYRTSDSAKRTEWRGPTNLGGSNIKVVPIYNDSGQFDAEGTIQKYTFGDAFCGGGGTSCGARKAGLHVQWAFDYANRAVQTYKLNFPKAMCYNETVHDFIINGRARALRGNIQVDVLHLSPPCQPFSPAHTIIGPNDEDNEACLLSVADVLRTVKPRIVTLEQTWGLVNRNSEWFLALIHEFLRTNYSIHWRGILCSGYGVPQSRNRLFIFAAGPGEAIPPFPQSTHGPGPFLKPVPTIRHVLNDVRRYPNPANHDTSRHYQVPKEPISADQQAKTITTNGGIGNRHPSGLRPYTVREFARFQTFPMNYRFADVGIREQKRQIGNAVPPIMAEILYKSAIKSLKETDARSRAN